MVPATRFRVIPVAEALRLRGWETNLIFGYGTLDLRLSGVRRVQQAYRLSRRIVRAARTALLRHDGPVVVQRLALPWWSGPEWLLAARSGRLIFDFDDAVFLGGNRFSTVFRTRALDRILEKSFHVVAGNSWLAERVKQRETRASVVPTCIDTSFFEPARASAATQRSPVIVGWIGTSGNFPYLEQLIDPLEELRRRGLDFEFRVCSDRREPALFKKLDAAFVKWEKAGELPFLQSLDLGLMPLADDAWCRGKCSFKIIQYLAVGCPVVASDVGMNRDVLHDSDAGTLVNENGWGAAISPYLMSPERRRKSGRAARELAVSRYDISRAVDIFEEILVRSLDVRSAKRER